MGKASSRMEQRGQSVGCELLAGDLRAVEQETAIVVEAPALRARSSELPEHLDGLVDLLDVEVYQAHECLSLPALIHSFQLPTQGAQKMPPVIVTLPEMRSTWP